MCVPKGQSVLVTMTAVASAPRGRVTEDELAAVLGRATTLRRADPRHGDRLAHHPVRTEPAQNLDRKITQEVGDAWRVVAESGPWPC